MSAKVETDVTTALTLIIPEQFHSQINSVRGKYDRAYPRWMPHVNYIFPFVPADQFDDVKNKLTIALLSVSKFTIELTELDNFKQKGNVTFHLRPKSQSDLDTVFNAIRHALPEVPVKHPSFQAHMTLGQCKNKEFAKVSNEVKSALELPSFTFEINSVYIIQRSHDDKNAPFEIVHTIPLGE